jgi:hypothetical protein
MMSYEGLRPRATALEQLAAYSSIDAQITGGGEPLQVPAVEVSPTFFATLGVGPARGRAFLTGALAPDDDRRAHGPKSPQYRCLGSPRTRHTCRSASVG